VLSLKKFPKTQFGGFSPKIGEEGQLGGVPLISIFTSFPNFSYKKGRGALFGIPGLGLRFISSLLKVKHFKRY